MFGLDVDVWDVRLSMDFVWDVFVFYGGYLDDL